MEEKRFNFVYLSSVSLIIVNMYAIIGVIFYSWDTKAVIYSYYLEGVIIILFGFLKILKAEKIYDPKFVASKHGLTRKTNAKKDFLKDFFIMGSAFILFYGFWLIFFFKVPAFDKAFYIKNSLFTFVGFLALSHTISYVLNYLIMEEYKEIFVSKIYSNFYLLRMLPMHFAIMIGILVGIPAIPLILIKTVVDLALHIKEHKAKR